MWLLAVAILALCWWMTVAAVAVQAGLGGPLLLVLSGLLPVALVRSLAAEWRTDGP